jgi:hypothetical protein
MSKIKNYLLWVCGTSVILSMHAQSDDAGAYTLMTAQDIRNNALSNITLSNQTSQTVTVNGLFIVSVDTAAGSDNCSVCSGGVIGGDNMSGAVASSVVLPVNKSAAIGQNYLYNMIYNEMYFIRANIGSVCALPGCSWPGDTPNTQWCVGINAASLNSNYTYNPTYKNGSTAAAVPAYGSAGLSSPYNYNYDLINPNTLGVGTACLGPITCNDQTLTCSVSTPQSEAFQPYS